jgi:hypothetical protein
VGIDEQPPEKGGYFLISFQEKAGAPWQVELRWGLFEGVKQTKGKFKVLDVCWEILVQLGSHTHHIRTPTTGCQAHSGKQKDLPSVL